MKCRYFVFLLLFSINYSFGQTGTFSYSAITNTSFDGTPKEERYLDDLYADAILFVNDGLSLYREHLPDSVLQKRMGGGEDGIVRSKLKSMRKDDVGALYKKDFSKNQYLYRVKSYDGNDFGMVEEPLLPINWILTSEQKTIGNYVCIKAHADVFGRTWEVWFTPEIPVSDGPWKLHGLAGLIVEASDSEGKFRFILTKAQVPSSAEASATMNELLDHLDGKKFMSKVDFVKTEDKKKDERKRARIARMAAAAGDNATDIDIKITFAETIEKY